MQLSADKKEVYCHACLTWHVIKDQLWLTREDGRIDIVCIKQYPEQYIHLGYEDDLP